MYGQLIEQAEKYLRSLYEQDNIAEQLKRMMAELMAAGEANADSACRAMRLRRRTLQRRLRAEKTSFQKILNALPGLGTDAQSIPGIQADDVLDLVHDPSRFGAG